MHKEMTKQLFDSRPEAILDLGTGCFNIHFNIEEVQENEIDDNENIVTVTKYQADVMRVSDVSYSGIVNAMIRNKYSLDQEFALQRQREIKSEEFFHYNSFCELCKAAAREILNIK